MQLQRLYSWLVHASEAIWKFIKRQYEPVVRVGNLDRVLKKGDKDRDEERLLNLNKTWREMLRDDPWRKKLMTHVQLLLWATGIFFLMFWFSGIYLSARHPISGYIAAGVAATIPYWCWVGNWHRKIEEKVWGTFIKRFGKHFHKR